MPSVKTTPAQYSAMAKEAVPPSPSFKNIPLAFLIGGLICMLGQGLLNLYQYWGLTLDRASGFVSITLIFLSALFTGLGCYDNIARHAGAGTLVPITGFANSVVAPALEFKSEGLILGLGAKLFIISGPVIVYGLAASWVYGIILMFMGYGGMK
ncbi:MAG: stage V sporulation protein AC [Oscillospiraceae bacterium]|jgi:stage V sporulation protein AC|nr:stage V sporulation protein AC [Oscillospiraceae bacterium]